MTKVEWNSSLTIKTRKKMGYLEDILVPIAVACVLPIMIVWFMVRQKMNETNSRTQIVLAAIEKNPDMDLEELMEKISPKVAHETAVGWHYHFPGCCLDRILHLPRRCWWNAYSSPSTVQPFRCSPFGHRHCLPCKLQHRQEDAGQGNGGRAKQTVRASMNP